MIDYVSGDVVVCIRDDWEFHEGVSSDRCPKKGELFRVLEIIPHRYIIGEMGVEFREIPGWYWEASYFRKLEKGRDIFKLTKPRKILEPV